MSTIVKAAAVQISPVLYSQQGTVEEVVKKIGELGAQGVRFATFPEAVVPYYPYFSFVQPAFAMGKEHQRLLEESVTVPSAETHAIGEAAKQAKMVVSIGVNERDGGSIYNTQLLFDADGTLIQRRRKLTPTYHERMVWGQGDGSGLRAADSAVGRIGQLACWEHYMPLARYALIADGEQIHSAMYPGSIFGPLFTEQTEANVRQHALESACFVVSATAWLDPDQQAQIMKDTGCAIGPISGGCFTAIVSPDGQIIGEPLKAGEGEVIADLDFAQIDARKRLMDARGHYSRPPPAFNNGLDPDTTEGAIDLVYSLPKLHVEYVRVEPPGIPTAFWRSVGLSHNVFVTESFMDELAAAKQDPVAYRLALLDDTPRAKAVLALAAEKADWGEKLPPRVGRGVSIQNAFATYMAQVAEVEVAKDGAVCVRRVVCAVDCGTVVNPDTVQAQIQSAVMFGITAALYGEITLKDGRIEQTDFDTYQMLRMNEAPVVEVYIVRSFEAPGGMGEAGTSAIVLAVANAIFAATGKRLRKLPVDTAALKQPV